jgi:hypothetical protein
MAGLTSRLTERIYRDFPAGTADEVAGYLASLADDAFGGQDPERLQAATVLASAGQWDRFLTVFRLLKLDWRDVLVAGELANADWPARLDAELDSPRAGT